MKPKLYLNVIKNVVQNNIGISPRPAFVTFFVTWSCNHRCVFCDVWKKTPSDQLSVEQIDGIFSQLNALDVIRITGGEPFVRKDLADIINTIDRRTDPSIIHITTNGINTARILESLRRVDSLEKIHIKVSIDDYAEKHDKIRGIPGAYDKAVATVQGLVELRDRFGIHVGINQAILDHESMGAYRRLKSEFSGLGVPIYASIAYDSSSTLYSEDPQRKDLVDPDSSIRPFGEWTKEALAAAMDELWDDNKTVNNFAEGLVDDYFMDGLYERMMGQNGSAGPPCVALRSHLRLLPNGDVPTCLYNGKIVGNLATQPFDEIWSSQLMKEQRQWVSRCSGCWSSCETAVSAVYTGRIYKGLFPKNWKRKASVGSVRGSRGPD